MSAISGSIASGLALGLPCTTTIGRAQCAEWSPRRTLHEQCPPLILHSNCCGAPFQPPSKTHNTPSSPVAHVGHNKAAATSCPAAPFTCEPFSVPMLGMVGCVATQPTVPQRQEKRLIERLLPPTCEPFSVPMLGMVGNVATKRGVASGESLSLAIISTSLVLDPPRRMASSRLSELRGLVIA